MTKRFKVIAILLAVVLTAVSCYGGVFAARMIDNLEIGTVTQYDSLDAVDENVGMVNVLVIGVDVDGVRSDTIMLVSLDDYSDRVSILSIPRDTRVVINGSYQKINATMAFAEAADTSRVPEIEHGGEATPVPELSDREWLTLPSKLSTTDGYEDSLIEQVKSITGLPVNYFVTVDFSGFMDLIAAVDGVDFNVPYDMNYDDPVQGLHIHLEAGPQHLDAQHAHDFVRFRHNNDGSAPGEYVMGDEGRIYWQQQFIKELIRQKLNPAYLAKLGDILEVFENNVRTNLTMTDVIKNLNALNGIDLSDITAYELPGSAEYIDSIWYYIQDVPGTRELVEDVFRPQSREEWDAYLASKNAAGEDGGSTAGPGTEESEAPAE